MKQCLWWVYCRRHSFAHGLDESSVSYSSLILYQSLQLVRLSYHLISYFCHPKYIYSVNSFFLCFFLLVHILCAMYWSHSSSPSPSIKLCSLNITFFLLQPQPGTLHSIFVGISALRTIDSSQRNLCLP